MRTYRKSIATLLIAFSLIAFAGEEGENQVSWDTLSKVKMVEEDSRYIPDFSKEVQDLDGKTIELKGFMMPLDNAEVQKEFVLSANPVGSCFFCTPGGPEAMVEVHAPKGIKFSYDTIVMSGVLELVEDDPMGMFYRLKEAKLVN